jgi:oligopeptide transport system permease protein
MAVLSAIVIIVICLMALFAPNLTQVSYEIQDTNNILAKPDALIMIFGNAEERAAAHAKPIKNWLGTDTLGRDLYSRVLYGARMSMSVGFFVAFVAFLVGTIYGAIAGYIGGKFDGFLMRLIDILMTLPDVIIYILIGMLFGRTLFGIFFALAIVSWVTIARVVRAQVMQQKEMLYVEAARSLGVRPTWILFRHILPNILSSVVVSLTFQIPAAILAESFLSYIGLGLQPPFSSWGTLSNDGYQALRSQPHLFFIPAACIFIAVLAFNFFGDGLRDALDPKLKNQQGVRK